MAVKNSLKFLILAYASEPDKDYNYYGDIVEYRGKRYWVDLSEETVEFVGVVADIKATIAKELDNNLVDVPVYVENELPDHVAVEPEYIVNADGSIKFTGFGLVRR